ncbi:MAG: hypothetical protein ACHQ7H_01705 [Candidatus Rokuibacteriota bacterium]|jgi:hypothetical protein
MMGPRGARVALGALGILVATTGPATTQPVQHVITFDHVAVQGFMGIYDAPEVAHLETVGAERPSGIQPPVGSERGARPGAPVVPITPKLAALSPLALAPGEGTSNPSFVQNGFLVESFWAVRLGTPNAYFKRGHFHPQTLATGFEAQHLGNPDELHGLYIRAVDRRPFGIQSLRYRVTRNRQLPGKPGSLAGFSNYDVHVLVGRAFDPRQAVRGQFTGLPVGLPAGNDPTLPWWTLRISGFETVQQLFIASSASVDFDDIVLIRTGEE